MKQMNQQARAEAIFRRKEEQKIDAPKAMAEYNAKAVEVRDRTARLRAARLAARCCREDRGRPASR
jgi:hypothetical protein